MHSQIKLEIISSLQYLNCIAFAREQAQYSSLDGWPLGGCHLGGGLPPRSCADGSDWLGGRAAGPSPPKPPVSVAALAPYFGVRPRRVPIAVHAGFSGGEIVGYFNLRDVQEWLVVLP